MITNALESKPLPIYGNGQNMRDWLYVEDHCKAIDLVLQKGKVGETYCIAGREERQNIDVARIILKTLGKPESLIEFVKDRPGHDLRYPLDSSKIEKELGFKQGVNFEQGLENTIKWYKENENWWKPLKEKSKNYYKAQYEIR